MDYENGKKHTVWIVERRAEPWRKTIYVFDADSGELLLTKSQDNIAEALKHGSWARAEAVFDIKEREDGIQLFTAREADGDFCIGTYGEKRPQRKRGGKKSYTKLFGDEFLKLEDKEQLALLATVPFLMPDGTLRRKKKDRPLGATDVAAILAKDRGRTYGFQMLKSLKEKGVIYDEDGALKVHRKFIGRG